MVKKLYVFLMISGLAANLRAQVGINNSDPKAQLDISSTNEAAPALTDGILIPRVTNFPVSTPTVDQHGMLIFLKTALVGYPEGFYYWNDLARTWKPLTSEALTDFYKVGTQAASGDIRESIYRTGNISIGAEADNVKLKVTVTPQETHLTKTGLEVDNSSSTPRNVTYSIVSNNKSITSDKKYGIKNYVSADGEGIHYGIYNETFQKTNEEIYGIYNSVGKTFGATKNHYGIFSEIGTVQGNGKVYGIYSAAYGNIPRNVFAGYFAGRVGIGLTPAEEYILPATKGVQDQVLVLEASGEVNWKHPNTRNYSSTTAATGNFIISDEVYTLRINNQVSSITIPASSPNRGRVIVLIGWPGISQKTLSFFPGDDLLDITTNTPIDTIRGGQRLTIQSAGNRWIVIGN